MRSLRFSAGFLIIFMMLCIGLMPITEAWAAGAASGIYDEGQLLSDDEERSLLQTLEKYSNKYETDIAIVTTNDAGGQSAQAYADAYAEKIGQSMKREERAGILFLIDMDNREIYIATQGKAIDYYDEKRIDRVLDDCYGYITDGEYAATCRAFLGGVRDYMGLKPGKSARMDITDVLMRLVIAVIIGVASTLFMVRKRGGRVTVGAATYFDASQSHLDEKEDRFMHRTVTRRHIPKPEHKSGGGRSGGGGVHVSSGGGVHGGGGRKF